MKLLNLLSRKRALSVVAWMPVVVLIAGCASTVEVTKVGSNMQLKGDGPYYWLPKTELVIAVPIERKAWAPGALWKEAEKLDKDVESNDATKLFEDYAKKVGVTGIFETKNGYPAKNKVPRGNQYLKTGYKRFKIGKATVVAQAIPDADEVYHLSLDSNSMEDRKLVLELSEKGYLTNAESSSTNKTIDYIVAGLDAGLSIAKSASVFGGSSTNEDVAAGEYEKKLQRAVGKIEELKKARESLVTSVDRVGNEPVETFKARLAAIDAKIDGIVNQFRGRVALTETKTFTFVVCPKSSKKPKKGEEVHRIFAFSPAKGVRCFSVHPRTPDPVPTDYSNNGAKDERTVTLRLRARRNHPLHRIAGSTDVSENEKGLRYRIPMPASAHLFLSNKELSRTDTMVAQWGVTASLPRRTSGRQAVANLSLHPDTGALKKATVGQTAFNPSQTITPLSKTVTTALDADIDALKRKKELLELENAIAEQEAIKKAREDAE